jgi:hypothetical protein
MKSLRHATGVMVVLIGVSTALAAQWADHPDPSVPKLPNGQPNLEAPAPRMADGKPDLSGVWALGRGGGGGGGGNRGQQGGRGAARGNAPAAAPAAEPAGAPVAPADGIPTATFFEIAGRGYSVPYTPWAKELRDKRAAANAKDNPDAHCLPIGLTQMHLHPQPRKIIQTPKLIVMLYEAQAGVRQIFLDGRKSPTNDPQPWWYGYSVGRWEGDTLVVETTGFRDDVWLDVNGSPLTETGKMVERMRRINYGTLETIVTIEDPKAYTKPFSVRIMHRIMPNTELIEFICNENEQSSQHYDK